jgi:hypothetical protein
VANWRDEILKRFGPDGDRLTVVHDPDRLLTEELVVNSILANGYEVLIYEDPIAFRYAYEANYRSAWDAGERTRLVVLVEEAKDVDVLPYDIIAHATVLHFGLPDIFPGLSAPVIGALDRSLLDTLWNEFERSQGIVLGDRQTRDFVLTHCYDVVPKLVKTPVDLMRYLLRRHYRGEQYPEDLDALLLDELRRQPALSAFPLEGILSSRQGFLSFLQDQWDRYLAGAVGGEAACLVPFGHDDIRVYMDNLFVEGLLQPIEVPAKDEALPEWIKFGVITDIPQDTHSRFDELLLRSEKELPANGESHRDWQSFASLWAETVALRWQLQTDLSCEEIQRLDQLHTELECRFAQWMLGHFGALASISPHPLPVMAHQIPRYLSAMRTRGQIGKIALLLIDGLAMDQWLAIRRGLEKTRPQWRYEVAPVFTWVPSWTPVCRQAIFAGQPPLSFPETIKRTDKDGEHWLRFWEGDGANYTQVRYWLGTAPNAISWLEDYAGDPDVDTIGMVISDVDEMAHGSTLGTEGLHRSIGLWAQQGHLAAMISRLEANGFAVYITADHGNVQATGIGLPREGVLVQTAGSRARFYQSKQLRSAAHEDLSDTLEWTGVGLPPGNEILLPKRLTAFTTAGKTVVTHGGIALEEIIVPFIRVVAGVADGA